MGSACACIEQSTEEENRTSQNHNNAKAQALVDEFSNSSKQTPQLHALEILSALLKSAEETQLLSQRFDNAYRYKEIYRGSSDGFNLYSLRKKCDNISNIFIVITSSQNNVFGAFVQKGISKEKINWYISDTDNQTFTFFLQNNNEKNKQSNDAMLFFMDDSENEMYGLFNSDDCLIQIGTSHNVENNEISHICLFEDCDKSNANYVNNDYLNGGKRKFKVKEVIVYTESNDFTQINDDDKNGQWETIKHEQKDDEKEDDNIYADSDDYDDYEHDNEDETQKVHIYVVDKAQISKFVEPKLVSDIDENMTNYAGNAIGNGVDNDWSDTLKIDITETLEKLKLDRSDAEILLYVERKDEETLTRLHDNDSDEDDLLDDDDADIEPSEESKDEEKENNSSGKPKVSIAPIEKDEDNFKFIPLKKAKSQKMINRTYQMTALRMKYSSRRVTLSGKAKTKMPRCGICNTYYHVQSDPMNAYNGVGIVCDICGKNRENNPEMLMEDHYYKCEGCENSDICSPCYIKEKKALNDRTKLK